VDYVDSQLAKAPKARTHADRKSAAHAYRKLPMTVV
jgi:hypothetical protein